MVRVKQKSLEKMAALQRKIDNILRGWKANKDKKHIVIKACRQYGVWVKFVIIKNSVLVQYRTNKNRVLVQIVGAMFC